jgi:hypothetical protein
MPPVLHEAIAAEDEEVGTFFSHTQDWPESALLPTSLWIEGKVLLLLLLLLL